LLGIISYAVGISMALESSEDLTRPSSLRGSDNRLSDWELNFVDGDSLFDQERENCDCDGVSCPCDSVFDIGYDPFDDMVDPRDQGSIDDNIALRDREQPHIDYVDSGDADYFDDRIDPRDQEKPHIDYGPGMVDPRKREQPHIDPAEESSEHSHNDSQVSDSIDYLRFPNHSPDDSQDSESIDYLRDDSQDNDPIENGSENSTSGPYIDIPSERNPEHVEEVPETSKTDKNLAIPPKDIIIFSVFLVLSFIIYLLVWRDRRTRSDRLQELREQKEKIHRLRNLYEGLDKYSQHILDNRSHDDATHESTLSPGNSSGSNGMSRIDSTIEYLDDCSFDDDMEFGEESSVSSTEAEPPLSTRIMRSSSYDEFDSDDLGDDMEETIEALR